MLFRITSLEFRKPVTISHDSEMVLAKVGDRGYSVLQYERRSVARMINEKVKDFLERKGFGDRLTEHAETIDTVEHAALRIGCSEPEIAKTLSFIVDQKPVIVVMAGDGKVNSSKFKVVFHTKPHMIPREQVEEITGFQPGGVCPFAVPEEIPIWLDISMKRFAYVHPADGNEFTSVKLTPEELEKITEPQGLVRHL